MTAQTISPAVNQFLDDVVEGLSRPQKQLQPLYFYDDVGSALFEAITVLPEYGLTRADERLLRLHAAEIVQEAGGASTIAELGCGTGRKTRWILEAAGDPEYHPIDVSASALDQCRRDLSRFARVKPCVSTFLEGLGTVTAHRSGSDPLLVLFLGSTIGNFGRDPALEFLSEVRALLRRGDSMLIGFDLIKPKATLLSAYDDGAGVTAAFNRNLLARMNRELLADFQLRTFEHEARFVEPCRRIEMHLRSTVEQWVTIGAARQSFHFKAGESIWTESSHKYLPEEPSALAQSCGFREKASWSDQEWPFTESLWVAE